jgi:hypothetical protein
MRGSLFHPESGASGSRTGSAYVLACLFLYGAALFGCDSGTAETIRDASARAEAGSDAPTEDGSAADRRDGAASEPDAGQPDAAVADAAVADPPSPSTRCSGSSRRS